jgi:hypothetical protein
VPYRKTEAPLLSLLLKFGEPQVEADYGVVDEIAFKETVSSPDLGVLRRPAAERLPGQAGHCLSVQV